MLLLEATATGGNNKFEGTIEAPDNIEVPPGKTVRIPIKIKIHPAEEPGETFKVKLGISPKI